MGALLLSALATVILVGITFTGLPVILTLLGFGICMVFLLAYGLRVLPGATNIRLDSSGIDITDYFLTTHYHWSEVAGFEQVKAQGKLPKLQEHTILMELHAKPEKVKLPPLRFPASDVLEMIQFYKTVFDQGSNQTLPPPLPQPSPNVMHMILLIIGWTSSVIALVFIPPLFGGLGFFIGCILKWTGQARKGMILKLAAASFTIMGVFFGLVITAFQIEAEREQRKAQLYPLWNETMMERR